MILIIDNYDSFTYNLYQYIGEFCRDVKVVRNDAVTLEEIQALKPAGIVISPGPGRPHEAGITLDVIRRFYKDIPILGICLGHQAMGEAFGGEVVQAKEIVHGKASEATLEGRSPLFRQLPGKIQVGRYHSLALAEESLPENFVVTARTPDGEIMAMEDREHPLYGLQFHPESVLTRYGKLMIRNFITEVLKLTPDTLKPADMPMPDQEKNLLKDFLKKVVRGEDLTEEQAARAMEIIMNDESTPAQIASFMTALSMKGETIGEITGFARTMRQKAAVVEGLENALDIVGTGGDMHHTFNISTTSAFVLAGAGAQVAKHGGRSVSSSSGSADVLESLGVNISLEPAAVKGLVEDVGVGFMFAPVFHRSMRFAAGPRRELGLRSFFNILGPLANPAGAQYILMGVYDPTLVETMGKVLLNLGVKGGMVVHGADGLDEVSTTAETMVCEMRDGHLRTYAIRPEDYGIPRASLEDLRGGDARANAAITRRILSGEKGPKRDIVVFNSGCALYARGLASSIQEGIRMAEESIDSGRALERLERLGEVSQIMGVKG